MSEILRLVSRNTAPSGPAAEARPWAENLADRVRREQAALLDLMKSGVSEQALPVAIATLTETTARTLGVARASVWRLNATRTALVLDDLYELEAHRHSTGVTLQSTDFPTYFEALKVNRVISAADARRDLRTREFREGYLEPLNIESMLDAAIWFDGESQGVVCLESVGQRRDWTPDEEQFAGSIADLAVMAISHERRRATEKQLTHSEERYSQVFRLSADWMIVVRAPEGAIVDVNASFEKQTGYSREEVLGKTAQELGLWAIPEQRNRWVRQMASGARLAPIEADMRLKSGDVRTLQFSAERMTVDGEPCIVIVGRDISDAKRHERLVFDIAQGVAAATGENFFRSLVERLLRALDADLAFVGELDKDGDRIHTIAVHTARGAGENFTYPLDGSPCQSVLTQGVCVYPRGVAAMFPRDEPLARRHVEGYVGAPLIDSRGRKLGLIVVLRERPIEQSEMAVQLLRIFGTRAAVEIERRRQLSTLEFRANHDLLTGLLNRVSFERAVDQCIATSAANLHNALLLFDLDRFKEINDTLGHGVGDKILVRMAERLARHAAFGAPDGTLLGRMGGDEYALWLPAVDGLAGAERLARAAQGVLTEPIEIEGYRLELGATVGIALHPRHGHSASQLMRCADVALYVAKRNGSGVATYDAGSDPYSPARLSLISQLSGAIRAHQFEVYYQPRVHLASGVPCGFEALVRWNHPEMGLLSPDKFIHLAELSDNIRPLTLSILDDALAQLARWRAAGYAVDVSVNLSARHLSDPHCAESIAAGLKRHALEPSALELEITESALIADPERATITLQEIFAEGVRIAIDDFGTGYSSLSHLKRLPLHALKIDVSFVRHMLDSEQDAVIVESIVGLAHNLGYNVVAEGIEDRATLSRLTAIGCDEGQGYYFGRPMRAVDATRWLAEAGTATVMG
ncbi:MAG: EAL domain-containing protein [Betaproteobacteria bacterium]|nr:EAL domain-containing protein [Betaproteobacteria bacterium]